MKTYIVFNDTTGSFPFDNRPTVLKGHSFLITTEALDGQPNLDDLKEGECQRRQDLDEGSRVGRNGFRPKRHEYTVTCMNEPFETRED